MYYLGFPEATGMIPADHEQQAGLFRSAEGAVFGLFTRFFEWFGNLGIFSWRVLTAAITPPLEWRELVRQLDEVGSKSLPLVVLAGAAIGVVISLEAR
jgi:ABC-type transporter Mla maintaining outer membrane lipid asymmetry permease subunit MlaE